MMWIAAFTLAIGVLQVVCLGTVFWCLTEVKAMQKSTHSIQYVPVEPKFQGVTDDVKQALQKDLFENVI